MKKESTYFKKYLNCPSIDSNNADKRKVKDLMHKTASGDFEIRR